MKEELKELVELLHKEDIEYTTEEQVLDESSRDASIFKVTPSIIIYPRNSSEISTIVRHIQSPLSISVRAGGTCMTGASLTESVLLNLTKHMTYIEVDATCSCATVEMGALYKDLEHKTAEHNLYLASYPSSKDVCGIAGMIGNNASGEKSIRYGATIDNVLSVTAILHDGSEVTFEELTEEEFHKKAKLESLEGDIYRDIQKMLHEHPKALEHLHKDHPVKKCASGYRIDRVYNSKTNTYNIAPLFVGSQSTLGILTEAKVKLTKKQEHHTLIFMGIKNISELPQILKTILNHDPESVETFDIHTFERARGFHTEHTNRISTFFDTTYNKRDSIQKNGFGLFVLAEFASDQENIVHEQAEDVTRELSALDDIRVHIVDDMNLYESIWKIRRTSFAVMRDYVDGTKHAVPCIEDVIVPVNKFDIFIPELSSILQKHGLFSAFHGHIGDGSLRIIPVFDLADSTVVDKIDALSKDVFALIKKLGGNMSADHSDGIIRTPYLKEFYGEEIYAMFKGIKDIFDPKNIFNPRKKIDGTLEDVKKHILKIE